MTSVFNADLIVLGTAIAAIAILGFVVLFQNPRSVTNRTFFLFSLVSITWGILNYTSYQATNAFTSLWLWRLVIFAAVWFCFGILHLAYVFPNENMRLPKSYRFILIPIVTLSSLLTLTPLVFSKLTSIPVRGTIPTIQPGVLIPIFGFTVIGLVCGAVYEFIRRLRKGAIEHNHQTVLTMTGTGITFLLLILCNFVLPVGFKIYSFIPFGAIFIFPFIACTGYAVIHYHLFNVRVIATEVFAFILTLATLLQIIFSTSVPELIFRVCSFILVLSFVILLIRSVLNEVHQRERIQKLADELEKANAQQVTLIHFITHQIKGFVTKSRNIFSLMLEGDLGQLPEGMRGMVEEGFRSDTKGAETIQEILNAANIKSGKVTYNMQQFDLKALIEEIVNYLRAAAITKQLELKLSLGDAPIEYTGDRAQLLNALKNLIDNSIKYTPSGSVEIDLAKEAEKIRFEIKDTGVGITPEDMKHLFTEGGHGAESQKINVESTGFGLYIVKSIIEGHKGKVWAESAGAGKGSHFIVELPA